ncbi:insulinase family protein [Candidatus Woesearchaeota archaeon]|nr:insulinase family protein [Candidatus Woesearchaeota archaeon]
MASINGKCREYRLDNGLFVALQNTRTRTAAIKLRVNYGYAHEKNGEEGLAHFVEHCIITAGSSKYDPKTADMIRSSFGYGQFDATTFIDKTVFSGTILASDLISFIDYISDSVLNPRFDQEMVDGERNRVLREIYDKKSEPGYLLSIEFAKSFYRGHPRGIFGLGKEEIIINVGVENLRRFHSKGYCPNNMELIVVGELPKNIETIVENHFGIFPVGNDSKRFFPRLKPLTEKTVLHMPMPGALNTDNIDESSATVSLSFIGPVDGDDDEFAMRAVNRILAGDINSLLYQNIGLKKGLAYQVGANMVGKYNVGECWIYAKVPARRIDEAIEGIFEVIEIMKTRMVNDDVLKSTKKRLIYNIAKALESNEGRMSLIELKLDEGLTPKLLLERCNTITPKRIIDVANKYLPNKETGKYVLSISDPFKR